MTIATLPRLAGVHEAAVESSPHGVVAFDGAGAILYVNPRFESIFGYAAQELLGSSIDPLLPTSPTRMGSVRELMGRRKDGSEVPVEFGLAEASQDGLRILVGSVVDLTERRRLEQAVVAAEESGGRESLVALQAALAEVQRLKNQLASENVQLRHAVKSLKGPRSIAAESDAMRIALAQAEAVAETDATVLLLGETGSGKEVFAEAIHETSRRRERPMVRVNCAAIPSTLLESELFGRERGAYTGALSRQIGRFELASGTTIFLDEIGDLPLEAQSKLLRVLQERTIERLGSVSSIKIDVRVIAATNRDLAKAVIANTFREDLYYRLNVFPVTVPPLRERTEDIPILVWAFVDEFAKAFNKRIDSISRESLAAIQRYSWPGNVRELRNMIERAVIVSRKPQLVIELPPECSTGGPSAIATLSQMETEHIRDVLGRAGWRVRGPAGAANRLGMKPTTLESRMAKLGIRRPQRSID